MVCVIVCVVWVFDLSVYLHVSVGPFMMFASVFVCVCVSGCVCVSLCVCVCIVHRPGCVSVCEYASVCPCVFDRWVFLAQG